ncbi:hypothetical protein ASPZODRAFT_20541 [Penicilliopsis zonata CBS 506.65]|uniref:Cation-transporting P-type ATPase N-terminal domain-containing protein n=1 Tax=Penicilliopsis zonata CBS 506.65 TaxID=1073090 RepID=A0A1L9S5J6_9EURO|nr:hypothetical protein ASPZODRAFT_20541 [Penicilliopsis zonata CBS 506.65]OJJ42424.1 hypothetical protein ASPZODRAFT_20541 [Penicilliopsis zonata CBS 506.65]
MAGQEHIHIDSDNSEEQKQTKGLWHLLSVSDLCQRLSTSPSRGLSHQQVQQRTAEHGRNRPSPPPSQWTRAVLGYLFGGFGGLLLAGCVLVFVSWKPLGEPPATANLALAWVLLAVFFIQAAFNAWQDWSSARVMASITTMLPDECTVVRDGARQSVAASDLVPGDILCIQQGNRLPADVRFVDISHDAKFDRSLLTGESEPVSATVESTDDNYLETRCIGLQSTHCVSGSALAVCVATGDRTVFGRIAGLTNRRSTAPTPMQREIRRFVLIIVGFITVVVLVMIILWAAWLRKDHPDWINVPSLIVDCVSVGIAFIPEGLPIALTMSLTIVANIMKKNKILCKTLATVETLGAVSVICSDKTGTLTKNEMFVTDCLVAGREYTAHSIRTHHPDESINRLRLVSGLCNAAEFDVSTLHRPLHMAKIHGDPTDQAILRLSQSLGAVSDLRSEWKKDYEITFNSKNKFMVRVMSSADSSLLLIKGAPDILLPRCTMTYRKDGSVRALSAHELGEIESIKDTWSSMGKRVILMAQKAVSDDWLQSLVSSQDDKLVLRAAEEELVLVGLVGIVDPPRDEIPEVIDILRRASIRIAMVTGDFKLTAQAIAIECGIIRTHPALIHDVSELSQSSSDKPLACERNAIVVSGSDLGGLSPDQWGLLCQYREIVFARTTPEQKLRIVKEFQARDNIVAMTGDGVNDAPSLKAADVGVALGSGSDIAIEAADMVLLDSFAAIVEAVKYGRLVFDNLKKTVIYLLPAGSFSELWPVVTNVALGVPQILSSFLMIIICCLTDCAGAITLAFEKPESDLLLRPPRDPKKDRLVDIKLLGHAYMIVGLYECLLSYVMAFWYMQRRGVPFSAMVLKFGDYGPDYSSEHVAAVANEASSIYFVTLVIMQFFNLLAIRTRRLSIFQQPPILNRETQNLLLFPAMLFALCMVFIFCYIPGLQKSIDTTSIPAEHFFLPVAFGVGLLFFDEGRKYCVRHGHGFFARIAW